MTPEKPYHDRHSQTIFSNDHSWMEEPKIERPRGVHKMLKGLFLWAFLSIVFVCLVAVGV